jgi:hypothetical protein
MADETMIGYIEFVNVLKNDIKAFSNTPKDIWDEAAIKNVNGLAAAELRNLVSIQTRRHSGAFFTDSILAKQVLHYLKPTFTNNSYIYDPACGAGNLLIAVKDYIKDIFDFKLKWEERLLGTDLHPEFIEAAQLRLTTNCLLKSKNISLKKYEEYCNKIYQIKKADGLLANHYYKKATHIFVNPPFNKTNKYDSINWAKGNVSAAALFIDKIIQYINPGVSIMAILPDVLRSGTRYEKWRNMIKLTCIIQNELLLGQFDKYTDVDVYAVMLTKKPVNYVVEMPKINSFKRAEKNKVKKLEDLFDVCVGTVVDNRDLKEGPLRGYIISKGLETWSTQKKVNLKRKHQGKAFTGPFVVIKRTSRMGDSARAMAIIVDIPHPVFVDNHLIVLKPKSQTLRDCKEVLEILKNSSTDNWINDRIRCRHLTVKVVSGIPID